MSLTPEDKANLLRFTSYSRRNSNAYLDTISNSALIAFLQFEQIKGTIRSQPKTVLAIDVFLDFLVGIAIDVAGGALVRDLMGNMVSRIVNSRFVVGKFLNTIPKGAKSDTITLYERAGVSKRFNFASYSDFLKAHRIEQANIARIQYGVNLGFTKVIAPEVKKAVKNAGKPKKSGKGKLGISNTVSIVDSAMAYAVNQKVLTDTMFDELENAIRLDLFNDLDFKDLGVKDLNAYMDMFKKQLEELHHHLYATNHVVSLDKAREHLILYFELCLWGITFFEKYKGGVISLESIANDARLVLFDDIGQDQTLTKYLVNRLGEDRDHFRYNQRIYSRADHLRKRLRQAGKIANEKKPDFGNFQLK